MDVTRNEKKYLMSQIVSLKIEEKIAACLQEDQNNNSESGYMVRSLYFDTLDDNDFHEKTDGLESRQKIRLRIYSPNAEKVKLEIKMKQGDVQRKISFALNKKQALEMIRGNYDCLLSLGEEKALQLYYFMQEKIYIPKCIVQYNRKAFFAQDNDTRITFDSNIEATEFDFDFFSENLNMYPVSHKDDVTMEVKYNRYLLDYIKNIVSLYDRTQISYGKYWMSRYITNNNGNNIL